MRYLRPVLLGFALVALLSAAVAGTPASSAVDAPSSDETASDSQVVRTVPNTSNYLDIEQENVERGEHGGASLDVGAAVAIDATRLHTEHRSRTVDQALGGLDEDRPRRERLDVAVTRLETRMDALEQRQQRAIERYNADEITTGAFLAELALIDVTASGVESESQRLRQSAGVGLTERLDERLDALEADLVTLRGPVRARAGAAMAGQRPATDVYVLTSTNGLVLSTTGRARAHREAHLPDDRAPNSPDQFVTESDDSGITAASTRASELYPWAYADAGPSIQRLGRTSVYFVGLDHSHGELETYLDGATQSAFRERQRLRLGRVPTDTTTANETAQLAVRVNRTYGTGPMEVRVTDPATGRPVDANVTINQYRVGSTGPDGRLWTTAPHRSVRIEVTSGDDTVRVSFFAN
jgi:hypothetical protein